MSDARIPIVMTGAAAITCLGATLEETWRAVLAGRCGIGVLTELESPAPEGKGGGQAVALPEDYEPDMPREARYLRHTIADALQSAGLSAAAMPYPSQKCGIVLGTTLHGMREAGKFLRTHDYAHLHDFPANAVMARAAAGVAAEGIAVTTCSACSSSLSTIALAATLLEAGELDLVIAGGYDPISDYAYGGFNSLRLVAQGPLRPFARDREGMKVSEGYGIVILERADAARRRGRTGIARILGYGESADAHHLTQPHPEGDGAARAIAAAMKSAGCMPADIDLIAAHATGTPDNDAGEYAAFARTFGKELPRVPVVGFKSHLGHTLGGAGAIELVLSAMALRDQIIPACSENVREGETDFANLNLATGRPRRGRIRATLNTSLGFGGANTCVILGPAQAMEAPMVMRGNDERREVWISGIGIVLAGAVGSEAFVRRLTDSAWRPTWESKSGPLDEAEYLHLLNARRVRRMSEYVKATLAATALATGDAGIADQAGFAETCSAILGTAHGSSDYCYQYYGQIVKQGLIGANPMLFAEGVPNAGAAHLSLMLSLKGACQTFIGTRTAGMDALRLASLRIASGQWDRAIVSAGEEFYPVVNETYRHSGLHAREGSIGSGPFEQAQGFVTGPGAVTMILESRNSIEKRGGSAPRGRLAASAGRRGIQDKTADHTRDVLQELGKPTRIMTSANGTWVDSAELEGIRAAGIDEGMVSAIYGYVSECFSALPLFGLAAVLLDGRLPKLLGPGLQDAEGFRRANGSEICGDFGVLATDFTGLVSGVRIDACATRP